VQLDESNAGELLRNLPDEPPRPPSIDIEAAMRQGRRRRLIRRAALTGGALSLTLVAIAAVPIALAANADRSRNAAGESTAAPSVSAVGSPSASAAVSPPASRAAPPAAVTAPTSCKVEKLPIPDNVAMALVTAADPTGRYLFGRSYPRAGEHQTLLWKDGKATKIAVPGDDPVINAVNSAGVAVGSSISGDTWQAWVYHDGRVEQLPGVNTWATGINVDGTVVGARADPGKGLRTPVIWRSLTAEPQDLATPEGMNGEARDIADDGTVVGQIFGNEGESAYAWSPDGIGRKLALPGDKAERGGSAAYTVQGDWATGINGVQGGGGGLRWNLRTDEVEAVSAFSIRPSTANASGWMVGTDAQGRGLLVAGGKKVQLPDGYLHKAGEQSNIPETISDDGKVIGGQADDAGGTIHAVVWHCG
jgi:hypothetical protein